MKRVFLILGFCFVLFSGAPAAAQKQIEQQIMRDPVLEADAKHNLDVAWQYFRTKKAYKAVLMRTEETIATHPEFSRMDEVLYLSGMSSYYLAKGKGKQRVEDKPARLREDAVAYFSRLVENYPDSKFKEEAEKILEELKPSK